jgi:KDO2-lipid IV(A) lauroyltransferase
MQRVKSFLLVCLLRLLAILPLGLARGVGSVLGRLAWLLNVREAQVARINLALCLPEETPQVREYLARRSVIETAKTALEMAGIWLRPYSRLQQQIIAVPGKELLGSAIASGKGLIVMTPHLGNWEVAGLYLSEQVPVTTLYQPPKIEALDALVKDARGKLGARLVPTDKSGVKALIAALRRGEVLGILPDQEPDPASGVFAPFFGIPALTMTLVSRMIARTGCKALMCYVSRAKDGFELVYVEPEKDIYSDDEAESVAALNRCVEHCIRQAPEQYQWGYKRFKNRPEGEKKLY